MLTFILVVIAVSILILVHEYGHFFSARLFKIKVEEFGFGFPPRIVSRVQHGIRYSLNALPLGGFVKIFGEQGEGEGDQESFISRPAWQRGIVLGAGVLMNIVLAWILFSFAAALGVPGASSHTPQGTPVSIISIASGSPAEKMGLKLGDKIFEIAAPETSLRIETEDDVRNFVYAYRGEKIIFRIGRGNEIKDVVLTPRVSFPDGEGPLGIAMARLVITKVSIFRAPWEGIKMVVASTNATLEGLYGILRELVTRGKTSIAVSGPVGIFFFARDSRTLGFTFFLQFIAILSLNLGILNLLPIPALDGGRILFLAIEKIKRRRINQHTENMIHTIGFVLLILLMVVVTYHDIVRIF